MFLVWLFLLFVLCVTLPTNNAHSISSSSLEVKKLKQDSIKLLFSCVLIKTANTMKSDKKKSIL
jgi:hypothetical protein